MTHRQPARGVLAGIKADAQASKTGEYNPNGTGTAWSHNFLNQKPWHPLNFRNQARVFEAEQAAADAAKKREIAKAEFEAEQEYMRSLSYLSQEEQEKFKSRQSVSFMYTKPAGMDVIPEKPAAAAEAHQDGPSGAGPSAPFGTGSAAVPPAQQSAEPSAMHGDRVPRQRAPGPKGHVGNMLGAIAALRNHDKWEIKHVAGVGRSPPRGGTRPDADNQQFVASLSDDDDRAEGAANAGPQLTKEKQRKEKKRRKLAEAEAVLRRAGVDIEQLQSHKSKKRKSEKKEKKEKKHKGREK